MELAELRAFVAVAELGAFSAAAEQLFLTQPAVSKRVAALEDRLGARLFDRIGRRVALTEAGRALLPRARHILDAVEDSRRCVADLSGEVGGRLRMGTSHHIGLHRLPSILRAFADAYPAVELDIDFLDSEAGIEGVRHGVLELVVVTLPPQRPDDLDILPLWHDPLSVMAARDHPLAQRKRLHPRHLSQHPAILPARGTYTHDIVAATFREQGLPLKTAMATHYLETLKMLVSVGLGWSVLPRTLLDDNLQALEVRGLRLSRELGIVTHPRRTLSNAARAFIATARDAP